MVNRVLLIGHVGKDPSCKVTAAGRPMVTFALTTRDVGRDGVGRTDWHQVVVFDQSASFLTQVSTPKGAGKPALFHQGAVLYVEGAIRTEESTDKATGKKTYFTRIYATQVQILDPVGTLPVAHEGGG